MSLTRVYTTLAQTLIRKLGDTGGPPAARVDEELNSIIAGVNSATTFFSYGWFVADPSTATLSSFILPFFLNMTGAATATLTRMKVVYGGGSHAGGGSVTFTLIVNGASTGFSVSLNDTNNAAFSIYSNDFADITAWTSASIHITARSGTVSERNVTIILEGFQSLV